MMAATFIIDTRDGSGSGKALTDWAMMGHVSHLSLTASPPGIFRWVIDSQMHALKGQQKIGKSLVYLTARHKLSFVFALKFCLFFKLGILYIQARNLQPLLARDFHLFTSSKYKYKHFAYLLELLLPCIANYVCRNNNLETLPLSNICHMKKGM